MRAPNLLHRWPGLTISSKQSPPPKPNSTAHAHYGLTARQLERGWPVLDGTRDARYWALLNATGLVSAWHFFAERFTVAGRWFLAVSAVFFAYGTSSVDVQIFVPLVYAGALWLCAFAVALLLRPRADFQAHHVPRVVAGAVLPVGITLEARASPRDWRLRAHRLPPQLEAVEFSGVPVPPLHRGQSTQLTLHLRALRRGRYEWPGFRVESDFPFGLMLAARTLSATHTLLVYPQFSPLARLELPVGRRHHPGGVMLASTRGEALEYVGNREFRDGDNIRDIDWRATARLNRFIVREYRQEYFLRVAVILDTHLPQTGPALSENFERAVSLCAAVSDFLARQDYLVDILAAGPNLYHLTVGHSLAYLDQILDILACVEESATPPFEIIEPEILENLAQITTVICVFLDWTPAHQAFVHRLSEQGAAVKVLVVRDEKTTLDPLEDGAWLGEIPILSAQNFERGIEEL